MWVRRVVKNPIVILEKYHLEAVMHYVTFTKNMFFETTNLGEKNLLRVLPVLLFLSEEMNARRRGGLVGRPSSWI